MEKTITLLCIASDGVSVKKDISEMHLGIRGELRGRGRGVTIHASRLHRKGGLPLVIDTLPDGCSIVQGGRVDLVTGNAEVVDFGYHQIPTCEGSGRERDVRIYEKLYLVHKNSWLEVRYADGKVRHVFVDVRRQRAYQITAEKLSELTRGEKKYTSLAKLVRQQCRKLQEGVVGEEVNSLLKELDGLTLLQRMELEAVRLAKTIFAVA